MRRMVALLSGVLVVPMLISGVDGAAVASAAPDAEPVVKTVDRAYGGPAVKLAPGQGVDVRFQAHRGDQVMLDLQTGVDGAPCHGSQIVVDSRGRRALRISGYMAARIVRMRVTGPTVLSFRGSCSYTGNEKPVPARAQLTKVRLRSVAVDGRTSVRAPRRGYLDVAHVRVASDGRDTLTMRDEEGVATIASASGSRVLVGNRLSGQVGAHGISVEAERRYALTPTSWRFGARLRRGQRVGLVVTESGFAESLRAREHRVALDGPTLTLPAEPGREHVLVYEATQQDDPYILPLGITPAQDYDLDDLRWGTWSTYTGGAEPGDPSLRRTIVYSDADGAGPQTQQVRMRRPVHTVDLVVDGGPVTFSSTESGTRFVATIPPSVARTVRLTASNASVTGAWQVEVPPPFCRGDCPHTVLSVSHDTLVDDGDLLSEKLPLEVYVTFAADATGSVTLTLSDRN